MRKILAATSTVTSPVFQTIDSNKFVVVFDGIPSYLIPVVHLPEYNCETGKWGNMVMYITNSIMPSTFQCLRELMGRYKSESGPIDFELYFLGPAGDRVSHWSIKDIRDIRINFGHYDWDAVTSSLSVINFTPSHCIINY